MAVDLSMIPQVSAPSLSADFFKEMANARQTAFTGLLSPIQATANAFVDNRTQQAQELIRQAQSVGDMQSPELQVGIQNIIDRSGGFVDQNAINQAQQDHLAQLFSNQGTYALSEGMDKAKAQEQVNLLVQQKIAQKDFEGARKFALGSVTSDGLSTALGSISTAQQAPILAELERQKQLREAFKDSGTIANAISDQALQYEKQAAQYEADAVKAENREIENGLGQKVKDPAGAAEAARLRADAAQLRQFIQYISPQQVLGTLSGAEDTMNGNPLQGGDVNSFVEKLINVESGGNPTAKNPRSTATGGGQFIDGTWLTMMKKYRPDLAGNVDPKDPKSPEAIRVLAMRNDPTLSKEMTLRYAEENGERLTKAGFPVNEGTLYTMHFLGEGGGIKALQAYQSNPNASAESVLGSEAVNANPSIMRGKTIKDVVDYSLTVMGNPKRNGGVSAASALASNYPTTTPSPVQAASTVTAAASQGASLPTATAATMNISSIPPEMQEKYKPYTDSKGNFLPIKFGNGKSIDTLDTEIDALVSSGQALIDQVHDKAAENRNLAGLGEGIPQRWYNPVGLTNKQINLHNWVMEMPIYAKARSNEPILTTTELNEVIKATADKLEGKFTSDAEKLEQLQLTISDAVARKYNSSYTARNKLVADGLANLAKQYGTTTAVLEKVLKAKGKHVRLSTGTDSFYNSSDVIPESKASNSNTTQSSTTQVKVGANAKPVLNFNPSHPTTNPKHILSNLERYAVK